MLNKIHYLTLCTFSFEINESRLSDTKCLIQDVVLPHCGDKRLARCCTRRSLRNYLVMTSYHWNVGTILYIRSCLLRELTASQLVAFATHIDTDSHNRLDLIQGLVPKHYVCNKFI